MAEESRRLHRNVSCSQPDDVLCLVFSFLDPIHLARCCLVCSYWNDIISKTLPSSTLLWKAVCTHQLKLMQETKTAVASAIPTNLVSGREGAAHKTPSGRNESQSATVRDREVKRAAEGDEEEEEEEWKAVAIDAEHYRRFHGGRVTVQTLRGHTSRVTSCSLRGSVIASGSADQTVRIWNRLTGRCKTTLRAPAGTSVQAVAMNDALVLAAAGPEICVWNRSSGRLLRRIGGHFQRVRAMGLEDAEVMAGCDDGSVRIFDLYSSACSQILRLHSRHVSCLASSGPLRLLASGGGDGFVHVYHVDSCQPVARLLSGNPLEGAECLHLAADGYSLTAGTSAGYLHRWDLRFWKTPLFKLRLYANTLSSLDSSMYAPSSLITAGLNGTMHILDSSSCTPVRALLRPRRTVVDSSNAPEVVIPTPPSELSSSVRGERGGGSGGPAGGGGAPSEGVLCVRAGMTSAVAAHADGTLSVWRFAL